MNKKLGNNVSADSALTLKNETSNIPSFTDDTAKKIKMSKRNIETDIQMDILINVNSTAIKRCERALNMLSLKQEIKQIEKKAWMIRRPYSKWQWTFLFGSNYKKSSFKCQDFFPLESEIGQNIWQFVSSLKKDFLLFQKQGIQYTFF